MKWWYGLILLLGCVVGIVLVITGAGDKKRTDQTDRQELAPGEMMVIDKETLKEVRSTSSYGEVVRWDSDSGELVLKVGGEEKSFILDPEKIHLVVPKAGGKTNEGTMITSRESMHWPTAFCAGDMASVATDENGKVNFADNDGDRLCGFRGE